MKKILLSSLVFLSASSVNAGTIGIWGGTFSQFNNFITTSGHTAVSINGSSNASTLAALDQVWLIRQNGNAELESYVNNGGTLVTEWSAAKWATDTANIVDATTTQLGFVAANTEVTFTQAGVDLGLGDATGNPYSNAGATQFFQAFTNLGSGVDSIATITGHTVGVSAGYGLGHLALLGWDWQDFTSDVHATSQQLVNDLVGMNFGPSVSAVPVPAAAFLFAPALLGFMGLRRKAKATIA